MIAKRSLVESERNINLKLDNYHNKFNTLSLKHRRVYYGENGHKYLLKNINLYNKQKGIVFIWPQRKKCRSNQEMTSFIWFFAQCLYYMHILNFWPNSGIGTGMVSYYIVQLGHDRYIFCLWIKITYK